VHRGSRPATLRHGVYALAKTIVYGRPERTLLTRPPHRPLPKNALVGSRTAHLERRLTRRSEVLRVHAAGSRVVQRSRGMYEEWPSKRSSLNGGRKSLLRRTRNRRDVYKKVAKSIRGAGGGVEGRGASAGLHREVAPRSAVANETILRLVHLLPSLQRFDSPSGNGAALAV